MDEEKAGRSRKGKGTSHQICRQKANVDLLMKIFWTLGPSFSLAVKGRGVEIFWLSALRGQFVPSL
jgi:hypothetical protein